MLTKLTSAQNAAEVQNFDESWMEDFVQKLSSFDRQMNEAVVQSGILKCIAKGALGREGKRHDSAHAIEPCKGSIVRRLGIGLLFIMSPLRESFAFSELLQALYSGECFSHTAAG